MYEKLKYYLIEKKLKKQSSFEISFNEVENILNRKLPDSAYKYSPWWANDKTHSQAKSWLEASYYIKQVNLSENTVIFAFQNRLGTVSNIIDNYYSKCLESSNHRFKSWQHCYEFFKSRYFIGAASDDEAALHLSFYLASWGMYRGSSFLLSYDYKINVEIVKLLKENRDISSNQEIFDLHDKLRQKYIELTNDKKRDELSAILTTKIMLGVYGIVPAYDSFLKNALKTHGFTQKFGVKSLNELDTIKTHFSEYADKRGYPVMKVIDMYFWVIGSWNPLEVTKEVYITLQEGDKVDLPTLNSNVVCGKKLVLPMGLNKNSKTKWFNDNRLRASESFIRNTKNNLFIYYRDNLKNEVIE